MIADDLCGYLRAKEPGMREKAYVWRTAIGLQKVDGLTPSDYLIETANTDPTSTLISLKREQVREQVKSDLIAKIRAEPSRQVVRLLSRMKGEMTVLEMMAALKLGGRRNFLAHYLAPAMEAGFVERTQPDSPHSPTQRYRLTDRGQKVAARKKTRKLKE